VPDLRTLLLGVFILPDLAVLLLWVRWQFRPAPPDASPHHD
jgi:hypothetical protein